jgi:uncharacterized radical SAM protein YgiQ
MDFLPISREELDECGWDYVDVIIVSADAYVDHPSFGHAVIARLIEHEGFRVAILPQPNWRDDLRDFKKLGKPRYFFGISSGMDSMVNHYTAGKRLRSDDAFTPGGKSGFRPDYATYVYTRILKELYPDVPVLIGGLEASLRRITHYDYWQDKLKPSILAETGADLLVYGMGEKPIKEILRLLKKGVPFSSIKNVPQTAYLADPNEIKKTKEWEDLYLSSHEDCLENKQTQLKNFRTFELESNKMQSKRLLQNVNDKTVVINPPYPPLAYGELDESFEYPYQRLPHPRYRKRGPIPAYEMIKHSITIHRGCFGGCSFCAINAHQGKFIASRSRESILRELDIITQMPSFNGTITDLGGPSANTYKMQGKDLERCKKCMRPSCLFPKICDNLDTRHADLLSLYQEVQNHPKVKHLFIGSGVRYDILLQETNNVSLRKDHEAYTKTLIQNHVSGRLKVAPEHTSDSVLRLMRKPAFSLFYDFKTIFERESDLVGKKQQIIPYFISSHPGCTESDMASLALETKQLGFKLEQVQDFTPTPLTIATEMYYAETLPNGTPIYIAKKPEQKKNQQRFFFWYIRENRPWIKETLERLKLGKISRLLLSRSSLEEGRTYFPSQEAPSSKPTSPRPPSPKSFSQNSASQRSASPKASFPKNSSHKQSFQNNKKSRSPYRRNSKSS